MEYPAYKYRAVVLERGHPMTFGGLESNYLEECRSCAWSAYGRAKMIHAEPVTVEIRDNKTGNILTSWTEPENNDYWRSYFPPVDFLPIGDIE